MLKITTPADFSPFDRPAIFEIADDNPAAGAGTYVDAMLEDADSGTILSARRILIDSAAPARFDAAPILRRAVTVRPVAGATGLVSADECMFRVRLTVGGTRSEAVTLLSTSPAEGASALVSTMPARRTIRYGESDLLMYRAAEGFTATVEVHTPSGSRQFGYSWSGGGGLVTLRLRTSDFDAGAERITVRAEGAATVEYAVGPASDEGLRIAWRTAAGSIEHYTFPVVARRTLVAGRKNIRLADGSCTVAGTGHTEAVVRSHTECASVAAAIAGIVDSPQVWAVGQTPEGYVGLEVATGEVAMHSFGEPSIVELTVRPSQNGVRI